jgi:predicted dehydrogenase
MSKVLTVAIVGSGRIAGGYDRERIDRSPGIFTHAGAFTKDGRFIVSTIIDADETKARRFAEEWRIPAVGTDIADLCRTHHDVISVCTPDSSHSMIISELIKSGAAKTIFAEKPLALSNEEMLDIRRLSEEHNINVVVNFQRRFDPAHRRLRDMIAAARGRLLAVNGYYIKGLDHIGTTFIDTICFLCGNPESVLSYNRVFNKTILDYTYEFILFFDSFNVTAKTVDAETSGYAYHIFEIDLLMDDKRLVVNDNSRQIETRPVVDYAYSGVRCLDDRNPVVEETGYALSMLNAAGYVYDITSGAKRHDENTPLSSYRNKCIVEAIKRSYEEQKKMRIGGNLE